MKIELKTIVFTILYAALYIYGMDQTFKADQARKKLLSKCHQLQKE